MTTRFQLSTEQIRDLEVIRDIRPSVIQAVAQSIDEITPLPLDPNQLHSAVSSTIQSESTATSVVSILLSLHGLMRRRSLDAQDVTAGINIALEQQANWSSEDLERWRDLDQKFSSLLALPAISNVAKALELSYEYAHLYQSARILTDIRPLFNDDGSDIAGAVVSHTLRLRYDGVDGNHGISIAVDEFDICELAHQCERAMAKSQTAKRVMSEKVGVSARITGGRDG